MLNTEENTCKNWLQSARIYHILIDRFTGKLQNNHKENRFYGGNISGVINKLEYIKNMGFNTILLSPFFETVSYHGYHITNFRKLDSHFGALNDLHNLIQLCHKNGMRIIADFVPNHCSVYHPYFMEATEDKNSEYFNWFYFKKWPKQYYSFLHFGEIPKLNLKNDECAAYMLDTAALWVKMGFDGFRIDHALGIPVSFFKKLKTRCRKIQPAFKLIGEIWGAGLKHKHLPTLNLPDKHKMWKKGFHQEDLQLAYTGVLDGCLDFVTQNIITSNLQKKRINYTSVERQIYQHLMQYSKEYIPVAFVDNHDMDRFMFMCTNNKKWFLKGLNMLWIGGQPISMFYGTEFGMTQNNTIWSDKPYADLEARQCINWENEPVFYRQILEFNSVVI